VNCTADAQSCASLLGIPDDRGADGLKEVLAEWGALRLVELGKNLTSPEGAAPPRQAGVVPPALSFPLWDQQLLVGEPGQAGLLSALQAAAGMAQLLFSRRQRDDSQPPKAKDEL